MDDKLRVGIVGLNFGGQFVEPFASHPRVAEVALCDLDQAKLSKHGDPLGIKRRYTRLEDMLADKALDAVHLNTAIPDHARQTLAVLDSGKHCACAVPMAASLADLRAVVERARTARKNYMMMATHVYTRQFLCAEELAGNGTLGRIQFLRGAHYQDMENWPPYWNGLPPMYYASHAVAPCFALAKSRAVKVHCFGSGWMREELRKPYGNPFPLETAIFRLEKTDLAMEVTRSLFHIGRGFSCLFNVYGENGAFEWPQFEDEQPALFQLDPYRPGQTRPERQRRIEVPDYSSRLPEPLRRFKWMHGAIPHLAHEFVSSILENRRPRVDEHTAANWTAAGICAHESALKDGAEVVIPEF